MPLRTALASVLALSLTTPALAQSPAPEPKYAPDPATEARISTLLDNLARVRTPETVVISPDGALLAWSVGDSSTSVLHLTGIAPKDSVQDAAWDRILSPDTIGDPTNLHPGRCTAAHPAWSPDGTQLAFLSDCDDGSSPEAAPFKSPSPSADYHPTTQQNLFLWTLADNRLQQISHLHGEISDLQWSPDGRSIAFLFVENATRRANATDAMDPPSGVIGQDDVEVQRVSLINPAAGSPHFVTPGNLHVYEFSWSPDSFAITFVGAEPPGENNWWVAKLYVSRGQDREVFPEPGKNNWVHTLAFSTPQLLFDPSTTSGPLHGLQIAVPRFSPDGKHIAFIGGLMSDQGAVGGDIYLMNNLDPERGRPPTAPPIDLTPNRPASPAWITWLDDGSLGVTEHTGGSTHLTELDLHSSANGQITATDNPSVSLTLPATVISGFDVSSVSTSHTENIALIKDSFDHAPEIFAGPLDHLQQITHLNDAIHPAWGRAESIDYTHDGRHLQGWLIYPSDYNRGPSAYDAAKKYPLIVSVHGGPSGAVTPRFPGASFTAVPLAALGYFVFLPNPRGSFGQGETFTQANIKDFGYGDLSDILAGLDTLEARLPIDPARIGITGWSYGGFMAMFAPTQTTRFKAAVAGAGISNWQSYYGENSIDQWMIPFFGASVYDDPAVYAKSSPIDFIKQDHTPTLVLVGDRDGECPAPQSFEFWHALRALGTPTQLVVYPDEGHHFRSPTHQRDALARTLDWFAAYMPPTQ